MIIGSSLGMMAGGKLTLLGAISNAGLLANAKLILDAGDSLSYDGTAQSWLDRSGGGYDFFRGTTSGAEAADPTFNGVSGGLSKNEFWSGTATTRCFRYDSANEAWMTNLHKTGAKWSVLAWVYVAAVAPSGIMWMGTMGNSNNTGVRLSMGVGAQRDQRVQVKKTGDVDVMTGRVGDTLLSYPAWHLVGLTVDAPAGAGGGFFYLDGAYNQVSAANTWDATYTAPDTGAAAGTMEIGDDGSGAAGGFGISADTRIATMAVWEGGVITKAQMDDVWNLTRGRFEL